MRSGPRRPRSLRVPVEQVKPVAESNLLRAYEAVKEQRRLFGLLASRETTVALVDHQAITRLILPRAAVKEAEAGQAREALAHLLDEHTKYGDAGAELPQVFLGLGARLVNLSGLVNAAQVLSLAEVELAALAKDERVLLIAGAAVMGNSGTATIPFTKGPGCHSERLATRRGELCEGSDLQSSAGGGVLPLSKRYWGQPPICCFLVDDFLAYHGAIR